MPLPNAKAVRCRLHHDRRDTLCIFGKHLPPMTAVGSKAAMHSRCDLCPVSCKQPTSRRWLRCSTQGQSTGPTPEVAPRCSSRRRPLIGCYNISMTCAADQGLDLRQDAHDDRFDSGPVWVKASAALNYASSTNASSNARIAEHIVLAGKTREHRGKSAPVFIAKVGVSPRSAKKHGNIPCS
jgi:hypothetical protein